MYVGFIIKRYASTGDGTWNSTPELYTDAYDVNVTSGLGDIKDTVSFKLPNYRNVNIYNIAVQDRVEVYLSINGAAATTDTLLINALVKNVSQTSNARGGIIVVQGVSFGEIVANALVFHNDAGKNVMQFLQGCLNSVALRNTNFNITWNTSNPTMKSNGSAFPTLNSGDLVKEFDKSLSAILDKYLTDTYTEDGGYFWYVNTSKELVIRKRSDSLSGSVTESDVREAKYSVNSEDVKNFIVVKCGFDYNDPPRPITTKYDDVVSRAKYGFRYYVLVDHNIAATIKARGGYSSANNEAFRDAVKAAGKAVGEQFATRTNKGLRQLQIIVPPTLSYVLGDKYSVTSVRYELLGVGMRVKEIMWDVDSTSVLLVEEAGV